MKWLATIITWLSIGGIILLDLIASAYQMVCFPLLGIPKVCRSDYIKLDRHRLTYLNIFVKFGCEYCAYANGILAYVTEIVGRLEQYYCPIKHAVRMKSVHSRYKTFFEYGDAETYLKNKGKVTSPFEDTIEPL